MTEGLHDELAIDIFVFFSSLMFEMLNMSVAVCLSGGLWREELLLTAVISSDGTSHRAPHVSRVEPLSRLSAVTAAHGARP